MRCFTGSCWCASDTVIWRPSAARSTLPGTSNSVVYSVWNSATGAGSDAGARGGVADRHRAHIARAIAHAREVALERRDALVELALADLGALDGAVRIRAAAANRVQYDGQRLRIESDARALVGLGPGAERSK